MAQEGQKHAALGVLPFGVFVSGTDEQGFAIQDTIGGIYISVAVDLDLAMRDHVEVTAQIATSAGLLILTTSADAVKCKGHGKVVSAKPIAIGTVSEATEGRLLANQRGDHAAGQR